MSDVTIKIGKISISFPEDMMFDIATLEVDLRSALRNLERIRDGKRHPGRPKKVDPINVDKDGV